MTSADLSRIKVKLLGEGAMSSVQLSHCGRYIARKHDETAVATSKIFYIFVRCCTMFFCGTVLALDTSNLIVPYFNLKF